MDLKKLKWTREPKNYEISENKVLITTDAHTDLWQRTYYHFQNDNAPVLQLETDERFFSFVVKTDFENSHHRFDQCGIVLHLDAENWLKASVEYENDAFQHLGSVVTNYGYSDWATTEIPSTVKTMWYRLSRREDDYCIECSEDGAHFRQMRICQQTSLICFAAAETKALISVFQPSVKQRKPYCLLFRFYPHLDGFLVIVDR